MYVHIVLDSGWMDSIIVLTLTMRHSFRDVCLYSILLDDLDFLKISPNSHTTLCFASHNLEGDKNLLREKGEIKLNM